MSELWLFLWVVASHWVVLVTGGVVTACLAVLQYWMEKPFSWRFYRWVFVMFMVYACFLAWREEYHRAQGLLKAKADLEGRLDELRSNKGSEEHIRAIEAELRSSQYAFSALQASLTQRRLTPEAQHKLTDALARHDGHQFGVIEVTTSLGCQECMIYRDEMVKIINSVAGWKAQSVVEMAIRADVTGLTIGVKDSNAAPPGGQVIAEALTAAALPFTITTINFLSPDNFILIVGNKP